MANTYAWTINALDVHPTENNLSNVVYNVHWGMTATSDQTDSEGNLYTTNAIGTQIVSAPTPDQFVDFNTLTEDDVISYYDVDYVVVRRIIPENCNEVWDLGYGKPEDLNRDCYINIHDLARLAASWLESNYPGE